MLSTLVEIKSSLDKLSLDMYPNEKDGRTTCVSLFNFTNEQKNVPSTVSLKVLNRDDVIKLRDALNVSLEVLV